MTQQEPVVKPCKVRMTLRLKDGTSESAAVVGEERRNCPLPPETRERYRRFIAAREQAIRDAQARRESA